MNAAAKEPSGVKVIASNRKAFHDYHILEKIEAGIELRGTEVKSIRAGEVSLQEGYAAVEGGQVFLYGMRVQPYSHGPADRQEPDRPKRLLLHRTEIERLIGQTAIKGHTLLPLDLHLRNGRVKVELGLGRGKQVVDKRETLKKRDADREARRAMGRRR
ncbi:MAG: SsrA-binding protein SmpB [Kiritimatiellae bacterium]|nr:SsrA-binding protein SmpB [Kiritimatiellia bacterium]MCO5045886.1 SsrA-binding protein SmpB [Kiritimatiellia bacterium]MCO5061054.1 SsrA-binding protein SmpB [Kiritimatiellia bacterium]MCO5067888.1 SsrA-binding protein SmpB [Kiritimatiellia bacterium]MCO6400064.1 SsrA-binding protein SmpB [Verrucomicrobiota bacterium]